MLKIGHRGAAGHAPENTLLSIQKALELGADIVEVDVQLTRDGELMLLHDKRVDRTTSGSGYIKDLSSHEVRRLDAGLGQAVPFLREALELVCGSAQLMIELIEPGIVSEVLSVVHDCNADNKIIIASFHHRALLQVRRARATTKTVALIEGVPVNHLAFAKDAEVTHVGLSIESLTEEFLSSFRYDHYHPLVYTVNDKRDLCWLSQLPVEGVISDYPERIPSASSAASSANQSIGF